MKLYKIPAYLSFFVLFSLTGCWKTQPVGPEEETGRSEVFENVPKRHPITPGIIDEASGLVASNTLDGYLWTHEDAGSVTRLFLLSKDGTQIKAYTPPGIINRDWEDIAIGGGPIDGVSYLYVGDIGNNDANPAVTTNFIYRIPEIKTIDESFERGAKITFRYPDGPRDAETLLFDPATKDLFVVSKELGGANLYRIPYPQPIEGVVMAEFIGPVPSVIIATGGDISADGAEIVIRTYANIFYWRRKQGETIAQVLSQRPLKTLPYELEPQGEAICFDKEMTGYYTLSERRTATNVTLNFYKRK